MNTRLRQSSAILRLVSIAGIALSFIALQSLSAFKIFARQSAENRKQVSASSAKDSAKAAKQTFDSICASCHGLDGRGGERGPNIATRPEVQRRSDAELLHILQDGAPSAGMPAFGSMGTPKLKAILRYVRTLQGKHAQAAVSGDAEKGKALFFGTARCAQCHTVGGSGGFIGSDLSTYASGHSVAEIRSAIVEPNKDLDPRARVVTITVRDGSSFSGIARNEDNFSIQILSTDGVFHLLPKSDIAHIEYEQKSLMPADYGTTLSSKEIDDLISYLFHAAEVAKRAQPQNAGAKQEEDDD